MECQQRVLDVFVTNADDNQEEEFDDQFICAVQSVTLDTRKLEQSKAIVKSSLAGEDISADADEYTTTAVIVGDETDWILPLWPMTGTHDHGGESTSKGDGDMFKDIEVGDLIRIGAPSTHGFTDYLTVVEKAQVTMLATTHTDVIISKDGKDRLKFDNENVQTREKIEYRVIAPVFALRLNQSVNATTLPDLIQTKGRGTEGPRRFAYATSLLDKRHEKTLWGGTAGDKGGHYYPMYHMKEWRANKSHLTARLDHGVKEVKQIKLMGYSLINKRQVGPQHAHEMVQDDYLILRIKEVTGQLISNNRHANGAFAVLYSGSHGQNTKGGVDVHTYETDGLVVQNLTATSSVMRNLTLQLTDRTGKPAHFGRLHLWFKITATHG